MKILIYTTAFAPSVGGVETYVMLLAKGLASGAAASVPMEVTVVTRSAANGFDDSSLAFRVVRQPSFGALSQLIRKSDLIQIAGPCLAPMAIAWLLRKPVVVEHHGYQAACPNGLLLREPMKEICPGYFMQRRYAKCLRCVKSERGSVAAVRQVSSTFVRRWLCNLMRSNISVSEHVAHRLALPKSRVIYHGIASVSLSKQAETSRAIQTPLAIGFVGRLVAEKGLKTLVDAAARLAREGYDFRLTFIGDGPQRSDLETSIDASGLRSRTTFTGYLSGDSLRQAVDSLSVVVMPSIWEETFGLSALEQMVRGRLMIVSDIGGLAEVVSHAGLKFPPGDADALAFQLRSVLQNPALLAEFDPKARQRAEYFSLDRMISSHLTLYAEMLADSRRAE